jgi:hypothetical protein
MTHPKPFGELTTAEKRDLLSADDLVREVRPFPFGQLTRIEQALLLLAKHEGKRIEVHEYDYPCNYAWREKLNPSWRDDFIYRIAPEPLIPDSINWDHVAPEYNYMARDEDGGAVLFRRPPQQHLRQWGGFAFCGNAQDFTSYRRGTVDWKDSLVIRPGHESSKP